MIIMKSLFRITVALFVAGLSLSSCTSSRNEDTKPRYIFLFIGDGMGVNQASMAESYLSYKAGKFGGERLCFTEFPYFGLAENYTADKYIACSASAGTSIACGVKTCNGWLGVDKDGNPVESIACRLQSEGYNIGIMTDVPVNHATPAAFYAHTKNREDYYNISKDILGSGFNFLGGAGLYSITGKNGEPSTQELLEEDGYILCYGAEEFAAYADSTDKIVYLQPNAKGNDLAYYDNRYNEGDISLKDMLSLCLDFIGEEEPFFIMCEGGGIDWAAHANMTMSMIEKILEFEEAIEKAMEFYRSHPNETLIVVTADHATGGCTLGVGMDWRKEFIDWEKLEKQWIESGKLNKSSYKENEAMNTEALIGWTSSHHTGCPVPVYAIGKGAEKFIGRMDNTDIKGKILGE